VQKQIERKNEDSMQVGQLISAVNNIYKISFNQLMKRGKAKHEDEKPDVFETSDDLVKQIAERLEIANEVAEDLMVLQKIDL